VRIPIAVAVAGAYHGFTIGEVKQCCALTFN